MELTIECPVDFQGSITGDITSRRGIIMSTEMVGNTTEITAKVPLAEIFGYSTDLRSMTQGQGTFSMEFHMYRRVPASIQEKILDAKRKAQLVAAR